MMQKRYPQKIRKSNRWTRSFNLDYAPGRTRTLTSASEARHCIHSTTRAVYINFSRLIEKNKVLR